MAKCLPQWLIFFGAHGIDDELLIYWVEKEAFSVVDLDLSLYAHRKRVRNLPESDPTLKPHTHDADWLCAVCVSFAVRDAERELVTWHEWRGSCEIRVPIRLASYPSITLSILIEQANGDSFLALVADIFFLPSSFQNERSGKRRRTVMIIDMAA